MRPTPLILAALLGTAAQAALAAPAPISIPPLISAATVQVSEKLTTHQDGKPDDIRFLKVKLARPNSVWIEESLVTSGGPTDVTSVALLVMNGKKQYDYAIPTNVYFVKDAPPLGDGIFPDKAGIAPIAQLPLLLGRSKLKYTLAGTDIMQGRAQHRYESEVRSGTSPYQVKLWIDSQTHLLTRRGDYSQVSGKWVEDSTLNFSDWKVNAPIPANTFDWTPPKEAKEYVAPVRPPLLAAGTPAPDFTVQDKDGHPVKLSDFRSKIVLLDFWATWCGPCQEAMPHTNALAQQYKDKNVIVLGVNVCDKKEPFLAWLPQHPEYDSIRFAIDPTPIPSDVAERLYQVSGIPTQYLIDPSGKILLAHVFDGTDDAVDAALQKAAGKP